MEKTVVVEVMSRFTHPTYHKVVQSHKKYHAHAEGDYKVGQEVKIEECRPLSKLKRWKVIEKVKTESLPSSQGNQTPKVKQKSKSRVEKKKK